MSIFETENMIKLPFHNTDQINHPISFLFKELITIAGFCMLNEKNRLKFNLRHLLSRWALVNSYT